VTVDLERIVAIDVHTHAERSAHEPQDPVTGELLAAAAAYFGAAPLQPTAQEVADYYRERSMMAVVFTVDDEAGMGRRAIRNEEVLAAAAHNPDVLIPFASIDPHKGKLGVREARRLIAEHGVRGFKFHPNTQAFWPNDRAFYPLYEAIAEAGLIALFHSGQTGIGAGLPGGGGVHLKYSNPMCVDDIAADLPELRIILAHPSFPWQEEALAVATHKPNVYIDLSGWSPKYFPDILVRYTNTILRHKMLFGSDYPLITPDRWLDDFAALPIRDEVRPLVLKDNAAALLGLRAAPQGQTSADAR
jgi:predicted TIM-barrel fold metal-dependent hydrolase